MGSMFLSIKEKTSYDKFGHKEFVHKPLSCLLRLIVAGGRGSGLN